MLRCNHIRKHIHYVSDVLYGASYLGGRHWEGSGDWARPYTPLLYGLGPYVLRFASVFCSSTREISSLLCHFLGKACLLEGVLFFYLQSCSPADRKDVWI